MANLQDLIKLAKADGGKFFVIDENGEVQLVVLGVEDYQKLLLKKLQNQIQDIEDVNREIIGAQLQDEAKKAVVAPEVSMEISKPARVAVDLREEVIDPSFDFEGIKGEWEDF